MSPEPWVDARTRIEAAGFGVPIEWPNEPFEQPDSAMYLAVEATGDVAEPIELGPLAAWQEEGRLFVHVVVPANSGSMDARIMAKRVANTFRGIGPNPTRYNSAQIGAGQLSAENGAKWVLTVTIDFKYQDRPELV